MAIKHHFVKTTLGQGTIMHLFPDIHTLSQQQKATINEVWTAQDWYLSFRRLLNDWETRFDEFQNTIHQFTGGKPDQDRLWWLVHSSGNFSVKSSFQMLNHIDNQNELWPWKHIRKINISYIVSCFLCLVIKETCLT